MSNSNKKGENNPNSKLTEEQVDKIREMSKNKIWSVRKLAQYFGISKSVVQRIIANKSWVVNNNNKI